jgi:hypothetical protein
MSARFNRDKTTTIEGRDMRTMKRREYIISACLAAAGIGLWLLATTLQAFDASFRVVWIIPLVIRVFGVVTFLAGVLRMFNALRAARARIRDAGP